MTDAGSVGIVVIGRNEGERLVRCLASVRDHPLCVYVDSGSTDGSVERARAAGVPVILLSEPPKFTAARARNAGLVALLERQSDLAFVQMIDGDCALRPGWIAAGLRALADPAIGGVFGRRRERFPKRSVYNALCDDEWNVPLGDARCFGGDVLLRVAALSPVGGYDEGMIAGEDPDASIRIRKAGWRLLRIDAEMTEHDAALLRFGQWWHRARRAGHAFAELAERYPAERDPDWRRACRSIIAWGAVLPVLLAFSLFGALVQPLLFRGALLLALIWPGKILQIALRQRGRLGSMGLALASGALLLIGKVPEMLGLMAYRRNRASGKGSALIEYKRAEGR